MAEIEGQNVEQENPTFTTQSGVVLRLRAVNKMALQSLILSSGMLDILANSGDVQAAFATLSESEQIALSNKMMGVLRYCMMYGVVDNPPQADLEEMRAIGAAQTPNIARMNWIMGILADDKEAGLLVRAIREIDAG